MTGEPSVRRAGAADAGALVALRAEMFRAMGEAHVEDDAWRPAARAWFETALAGRNAAAFVADGPDGVPIACAVGIMQQGLPAPGSAGGLRGRVSSVVTLPQHRRRGAARGCLVALIDWFRDGGVPVLALNATADGAELYRSLGFREHPHPELRLRL